MTKTPAAQNSRPWGTRHRWVCLAGCSRSELSPQSWGCSRLARWLVSGRVAISPRASGGSAAPQCMMVLWRDIFIMLFCHISQEVGVYIYLFINQKCFHSFKIFIKVTNKIQMHSLSKKLRNILRPWVVWKAALWRELMFVWKWCSIWASLVNYYW